MGVVVSTSSENVENPEEVLKPLNAPAIRTLVEGRKAFLGFLRRHLPDAEIAEDIFQQSLLKALTKQDSMQDPESIVPWFYRILRHALIDFYRARGSEDRKNAAFVQEILRDEAEALSTSPEMQASLCGCMKALIPSLKPEYATLLQQIDLEGRPMGDVSSELGISPGNLSVRLHRARQALRASLIRSCGACTEHGCLDCTCKKMP
jgi:RNA polymerase sigma-70 factor (ECF subfamily)